MSKKDKDSSAKGHRQLHVKVKTARGRKSSSTRWLQRQLNDPYVLLAQKEGYRSRAAFKLLEINDKYNFLKSGVKVVDLGSAPGGWSQICEKKVGSGNVIAIDIQDMEPIAGVEFIKEDFTTDLAFEKLNLLINNKKIDVVLSDMAAASCGHKQTDHLRIIALCEIAYDFAKDNLANGGTFVAKILRGGAESDLLNDMKKSFEIVKHFKPESSRKDSSEMYVIATGFKGDINE